MFQFLIGRLLLARLITLLEKIVATQKELADKIDALTGVVDKIGGETAKSVQMIGDLQTQLATKADADPALVAAVDALAAHLKTVDDLIPDAPVEPPASTP